MVTRSVERRTRRLRLAPVAIGGLLVVACSGASPAASVPAEPTPSDFPALAATAPAAWTSLTPTAVVTTPFSGVGSQYVMDVVAYRDGFVAVGEDFQSDSRVDGGMWFVRASS